MTKKKKFIHDFAKKDHDKILRWRLNEVIKDEIINFLEFTYTIPLEKIEVQTDNEIIQEYLNQSK